MNWNKIRKTDFAEKRSKESSIEIGANGASAASLALDENALSEHDKDERERVRARILGDLRRLDAANNFNSKEINELYDILARIQGAPKLEEKVYKREDFKMHVESYSKNI